MRYCEQTVAGRGRGKRSRSTHPRPSVALGGCVRILPIFPLGFWDVFRGVCLFGLLIAFRICVFPYFFSEFGIFRQTGKPFPDMACCPRYLLGFGVPLGVATDCVPGRSRLSWPFNSQLVKDAWRSLFSCCRPSARRLACGGQIPFARFGLHSDARGVGDKGSWQLLSALPCR